MRTFTIEAISDVGERLDIVLGRVPEIGSRSRAQQLIKNRVVQVNGVCESASRKLRFGDVITYHVPLSRPTELTPLPVQLDILFEDGSVLVVNKPAGLVVHPAAGHADDTLVNALIAHDPTLAVGLDKDRPGIVHRLDKDTSGLLVVAKTPSAHRHLVDQFQSRQVHRVYWALASGTPAPLKGRLETQIGRHPSDRKRFTVLTTGGKVAITNYEVLQSGEVSLLSVRLETGRTHQIRVHMAHIGHPLVGDAVYAGRIQRKYTQNMADWVERHRRFALHAAELGFRHPITGTMQYFYRPWPIELEELCQIVKVNLCPAPSFLDTSTTK